MATHLPSIFVVTTLLVLLPLAYAADCTGSNPTGQCGSKNVASRNEQYAARQNFCGNNLWQTTRCYVDGKVKIMMSNPGANNQQVCWDALDNIINQCGANFVRGVYNFNNVQYTLTRCVANDGGCSGAFAQ